MKILCIDTSTKSGLVLLKLKNKVLKEQIDPPHNQAALLIPTIQKIIENAKININTLDFISVITGPGSFTGIRIGIAAAKSISLSINKPTIGISKLQLLANFAQSDENYSHKNIISIIEANKDEDYFQVFDENLEPITEPAFENKNKILDIYKQKDYDFIRLEDVKNYNETFLEISLKNSKNILNTNNNYNPINSAAPLYIKPHYAEKNKQK